MRDQTSGFERISILGAEIEWPKVVAVAPDWAALRSTQKTIVVSLRVGRRRASIVSDAEAYALILKTAKGSVTDARQAGLKTVELQIDFDAAERQLTDYAQWLKRLRSELKVPLSFTALPSWLGASGMQALAQSADRFVLQVHWLRPPKTEGDPLVLCEPAAAKKAVKKAGRLGVPFDVALPTYGYQVAYDTSGRVLGVEAERTRRWPRSAKIEAVRTDPKTMLELLKSFEAGRPQQMRGVIWYRLGVQGDRLNWHPKALKAVIAGRMPRAKWRIKSTAEGPLHTIELLNEGSAGGQLPTVSAAVDGPITGDAHGRYAFERSAGGARFLPAPRHRWMTLPPDGRITLGWVRSAQAGPISLRLED